MSSTADHYRKKPVEVEAIRVEEAHRLAGSDFWALPQWLIDAYEGRNEAGVRSVVFANHPSRVLITTLEGTMTGDLGDWIIRGVQGELYPCKPDIFDATYEPVPDLDAVIEHWSTPPAAPRSETGT